MHALDNTLTPSTATLSGQKLSDVCMNKDHWWYADDAGDDGSVSEGKPQAPSPDSGLTQADVRRDNGFGEGKMAGGRCTPAATLGPSGGVAAGLVVLEVLVWRWSWAFFS